MFAKSSSLSKKFLSVNISNELIRRRSSFKNSLTNPFLIVSSNLILFVASYTRFAQSSMIAKLRCLKSCSFCVAAWRLFKSVVMNTVKTATNASIKVVQGKIESFTSSLKTQGDRKINVVAPRKSTTSKMYFSIAVLYHREGEHCFIKGIWYHQPRLSRTFIAN